MVRKRITERILDEVKGRMLEEIVPLETKKTNPDLEVFKLQFPVGEFDMVVYDPVNVCYRIKVAAEWSKLNQVEILTEMINCEDCRMDGVKTPFCDSLCQIRQCAMSQKVETCISCGQMKSCEKLKMISYNNDIFSH